jgi:hypothetical protein
VHLASRGTDGARRVHAELVLGREVTVGHQAVELYGHSPSERVTQGCCPPWARWGHATTMP